jgi:hypothetical protein
MNKEQNLGYIAKRKKLEPVKTRRVIEQLITEDQLSHELITALPKIYEALKIDNYSVMSTGDSREITPVGRVLQEVIGLRRAKNLEDIIKPWLKKGTDSAAAPGE